MILNVPFYSQVGQGFYNACGEIGLKSVIEYLTKKTYNINEIENAIGRHGKQDSAEQLQRGAGKLGVKFTRQTYSNVSDIKKKIDEGKPCICLVDYWRMPNVLKAPGYQNYASGHFIVAIGYGNKIEYYDPLYVEAKRLSINSSALDYAWHQNDMIFPVKGRLEEVKKPITKEDVMSKEAGIEIRRGLVRAAMIAKMGLKWLKAFKQKGKDTIWKHKYAEPFNSWDEFLDSGRISSDIVEE